MLSNCHLFLEFELSNYTFDKVFTNISNTMGTEYRIQFAYHYEAAAIDPGFGGFEFVQYLVFNVCFV